MKTSKAQVKQAKEIADIGIALVKSGKVRNHKLGNSSRIHTGEVEKKEYQTYRDFLPSKNCCMVYELIGSDNL
ncbi:MAG: hypothetical protein K2J60_13340 [Acetatifactor sp.]|nr:hypothetical protein [Acetatifactor sp.]